MFVENRVDLNDEQLVKLHLAGEQEAFNMLIKKYIKLIYNFVFAYVRTPQEAEDITQDAFIKMWKNISKFDGRYAFKTWAYTIAKNTALDALRKKGFVPFSEMEVMDDNKSIINALVSDQPLPEELIVELESAESVNVAIMFMPKKYRTVLSLYYGRDLTFREIAGILKQPIDTVKTRHRRAILYLKRVLLRSDR